MFGNFPINGPKGNSFEPKFNQSEKTTTEQKVQIDIGKSTEPAKADFGWETMGLNIGISKNAADAVKAYASVLETTNEFNPKASLNPELSKGLDEYLATLKKVDPKTRMNVTQATNSFDAWYGDMEEFKAFA